MEYETNPNFSLDGNRYKYKYVCTDCRKVFKRKILSDFKDTEECFQMDAKCPQCSNTLIYVGQKFRAPRIQNEQAWKSLAILLDIGLVSYDGWASPHVDFFTTKKALRDYLENQKEEMMYLISKMHSKEINAHQCELVKKIDQHLKNL